jgi:hypothetical protein
MTPEEMAGGPYKVRSPRFGARVFGTIGGVLVVLAVLWWAAFYVNAGDIGEYVTCLFYSAPSCTLVTGASEFGGYLVYQPLILRIGISCIVVALLLLRFAPGNKMATVSPVLARTGTATMAGGSYGIGKGGLDFKAFVFWAFVGIPLAWGVWITLNNAMKIF